MRVLIVDDEEDIRDLLEYNLKQEGYLVQTAENGVIGIEKAKSFNPDLIVLDVMMPEMDGIETCEQLRSQKQFERTTIWFLTARSEDYSQIAGLEAGADDYISKPIKPKVFKSKVKSLLRRSSDTNFANVEENKDFIIDRSKYLVVIDGNDI